MGVGNIVGVATAIHLGGPGALFGCGLPPCSVWPRSARRRSLP
ncbi:MAG: alanine:cation symporter family protein [Ancrocorticia sp.]|nr:alanine:cation symporter family protein [Ancrocorticia sp.]MCI1896305.1 alanine:cation symporter family protein [Ancrocorticia sp.]MCI1933037.1 alanine:cation symporter family protein [Ancrocorticia sp.]MCI1964423.1 alanine:cation symporter family protein [Ancrocorticia sp.]MCI2003182.1 alanine:cation symporter family protein [Ancrocorticia sp.]